MIQRSPRPGMKQKAYQNIWRAKTFCSKLPLLFFNTYSQPEQLRHTWKINRMKAKVNTYFGNE
jgi:hypothetical protein